MKELGLAQLPGGLEVVCKRISSSPPPPPDRGLAGGGQQTETKPSGWAASHSPDRNATVGAFGLRAGFIKLKAENGVYLLP